MKKGKQEGGRDGEVVNDIKQIGRVATLRLRTRTKYIPYKTCHQRATHDYFWKKLHKKAIQFETSWNTLNKLEDRIKSI